MGKVLMTCEGSCDCRNATVDAHFERERTSQTFLASLLVCTWRAGGYSTLLREWRVLFHSTVTVGRIGASFQWILVHGPCLQSWTSTHI